MRPIIKYPVTLFILLLIGYSQLFAHLYRVNAFYTAAKNLKYSAHTSLGTSQNDGLIICNASSKGIGRDFEIEATDIEEEEDEVISSKKYLEISNYFTTLFNAQLSSYFLLHGRSLPFFKHFSYTTSYRLYTLLRVIRI